MNHRIEAVYSDGVFRPVEPVTFAEGTRVVVEYEVAEPTVDPQELIRAVDEIAALPSEGPDDGFSGADHDKILYGKDGAR